MAHVTFKQAKRRYQVWFWPLMALYTAAILGGTLISKQFETDPIWFLYLLTAATVLPIFGVLFIMWRYIQETDEFTRMMQLEAMSIGALITVGAATVIGFMQLFELIETFPVFLILPFFFVSYGVTKLVRGKGACV
ncbi:hypothetical protein [Ponticaulis sp.]|uniref:hypothetical protein n=1 Tax=Ponticaulis sp. TaxID=2020902 RepID=UPI000C4E3229|nr:hypothetical protein [Ponticaulis sp.]MAJ10032.1 hypothetical protein [Ponticaulis sp.]HBJ92166.1 hypothetical protein [Hyphomonadaceae bacterium]|tara:strand:- start:13322 stop:13729 length:408 start_codon:yes stop_codon:yes gene_type:complete